MSIQYTVPFVIGAVIILQWLIGERLRKKGLAESTERAAMITTIYNEILRSWAAHAANERIEGLPLAIETEFNAEFDWLMYAAIVIRQGFDDVKYHVVLRDHIRRRSGVPFRIVGAFTFESVSLVND